MEMTLLWRLWPRSLTGSCPRVKINPSTISSVVNWYWHVYMQGAQAPSAYFSSTSDERASTDLPTGGSSW